MLYDKKIPSLKDKIKAESDKEAPVMAEAKVEKREAKIKKSNKK